MISIIFGLLSIVLGGIGIWMWWAQFMQFAMGFLPMSLIMAGIVALVMGISGLRSKRGK